MVMVVDEGCSHSKVMLWLKVSLSTGLLYCEIIQSTRPQVTQAGGYATGKLPFGIGPFI